MRTLLMMIIPFVGIMGFLLYPVMRWKWSFSRAPLFGISTIIVILYIFGLFNLLLPGFYLVVITSVILTFLAIYSSRRRFKEVLSHLFSPAFVIFILMFALLAYLSRSWQLTEWDEYSHWGIFAKAIYFKNKLPAQVAFVIVWPHYPPGITIFQYYVTRLMGYSERAVFFAQNIVMLAAVIALLNDVPWKKSVLALGALFFGYWSIYFWGYKINSIYMDALLGVVFGAAVLIYLGDEKRDVAAAVRIAPILFILPLIKQLGTIFALIIVAIIIVDQLILENDWSKGIKNLLNKPSYFKILRLGILFVIPFLASYSWTLFLRFWSVDEYAHNVQLNTLLNSFSIFATDIQRNVVSAFFSSYQNTKVGYSPYGSANIIIAFLVFTFVLAIFKPERERKRLVLFQSILLIGFLLYSAILLTYFIITDDPLLQSYTRYIGSYCIGWSYVTFGMFSLEVKNDIADHTVISQRSVFLTLFYSLFIVVVFALTPLVAILTPPAPFAPRTQVNELIGKYIPLMDENSRVWIIWQNTSGLEFHITRYLIAPRSVQGSATTYRWSLGKPYYEGDLWTYDMNPERWRMLINEQNYDYVLVGKADEQFWQTYGSLFCGADFTTQSQLFKVESNCFAAVTP